ncbi:MAG: UvrD-helicase domain-containing protein [Actinomycetota bacterium]|nr:UvrD-helicase domain-containing protein [Actinomycetota bacterium]
MLAETITEGLNPEQKRAVETTEGPLLVLAGAGSGKTRVLTHRIAYLIGVCGIPAESILAVTFTNKAAGEMRERVEKLLGPGADGIALGTFHSVCVRILRRDIHHLQRDRGFVIYDDADSLGVVKETLRRHDMDPKVHDPRRLRWRFDQWKNQGLLPDQARADAADIEEEQSADLYATYQKLLFDANALDFGDILLQTVQLFERFPRILEYYQRRWQYVLVDEYQDTNRVQYQLVRQLAEGHRNIAVVGDPDQSIYAWRGADVRNILDFEEDYEDARSIKLERNYRSTQPILSAATAVVKNNLDRPDKTLFTDHDGGDPIRYYEAFDDRDEAAFVIGRIERAHREEDMPYGHAAILYRTNAQSRSFEERLLEYDIPYTIVGGQRFYERAEVKDVLAYLRLVVNPADNQAFLRIVNKPTRGIGKTTIERVQVFAQREGLPLVTALGQYVDTPEGQRVRAKAGRFLSIMSDLAQARERQPIHELISHALHATGYLEALAKEGTPEAESRVDNLKELVTSAEDFHVANQDDLDPDRGELELYLDQVALISDLDSYEDRNDRVSLMTVHSAKGLEFPLVFLVGLEERIFPHASSMRDDGGIEEERRLCYVAMTRAMRHLFITSANERRRFGEHHYQSPSRFLAEVPEELIEVLSEARRPSRGQRVRQAEPAPVRDGYDYSYSQDMGGEEGGVAKGTRVRHPVFGLGEVLAVMGDGLNQKLKIKFERAGVKTVMVRYANLELV